MQFLEFDVGLMYRWRRGEDMVYDELTILAIFVIQALVLMWQIRLKKDVLMADFEEIGRYAQRKARSYRRRK